MKINTLAVKNPYLDRAVQIKQKPIQQAAPPKDNINIASALNINKGTIIDIKI